jgi:hypothetical protein
MQTKLGNKIQLSLEQRLDMAQRIINIFQQENIQVVVDWDVTLDFPIVEPATAVSQLSKGARMQYMKLINRMIEVTV